MENVDYPLYANLYGKCVELNDRWDTVHIWTEELAHKNKGKWIPLQISEEAYSVAIYSERLTQNKLRGYKLLSFQERQALVDAIEDYQSKLNNKTVTWYK